MRVWGPFLESWAKADVHHFTKMSLSLQVPYGLLEDEDDSIPAEAVESVDDIDSEEEECNALDPYRMAVEALRQKRVLQ